MNAAGLSRSFQDACAADGPLDARLEAFSQALRVHGPPFVEACETLVAHLRSQRAGATAPGVGDRMPSFLLPDKNGRLLDLNDLLGNGPAVISFNRGHWCQYCVIELSALQQAYQAIRAQGATVVSIVPETPQFTAELSAKVGDAFPVLSDFDNAYSRNLGLDVPLGEDVHELYLAHGLRLDKYQANDEWIVPIPATYVVAPDGKILACQIDPDFRRRMNVEKILAVLCGDVQAAISA